MVARFVASIFTVWWCSRCCFVNIRCVVRRYLLFGASILLYGTQQGKGSYCCSKPGVSIDAICIFWRRGEGESRLMIFSAKVVVKGLETGDMWREGQLVLDAHTRREHSLHNQFISPTDVFRCCREPCARLLRTEGLSQSSYAYNT